MRLPLLGRGTTVVWKALDLSVWWCDWMNIALYLGKRLLQALILCASDRRCPEESHRSRQRDRTPHRESAATAEER